MPSSPSTPIRLILSTLLTLAAVSAHPHSGSHSHLHARATPQVYKKCTKANNVAITFDDGPYLWLRDISDHFTDAGAQATFFWNGLNFACMYDTDRMADMKYVYAAGHQVASHTWSHPNLSTLTTEQIEDNMYRLDEGLSRILGVRTAFVRPPYGAYTDDVESVAFACGESLAIWDTDTNDAAGATLAQSKNTYDTIATSKPSNALTLQHETVATTHGDLVPYAINVLQSKGYKLVTLAECLGVDPYQIIGLPQTPTAEWTCSNQPAPGQGCGGSIPCKSGLVPVTPAPVPAGTYFHPQVDSKKCLAVASNNNGAAVTIQDCADSTLQAWTVSTSGAISVFGNKCLDVVDGANVKGTKLQIWDCSPSSPNANQKWTLSGSAVQWTGKSLCLDLAGGSTANGNRMQIWTCDGTINKQWTRTTGPGTTGGGGTGGGGGGGDTGTTPSTPLTGKTIRPNKSSTTCLTASSNTDGATVVVQPCTSNNAAQQWTQNGPTIIVHGNKCLDVKDGNTANGAKFQIWSCTPGQGGAAQKFTVTAQKTIQWTGKNRCLDLAGGSTTAGTVQQTWECSGTSTPYVNQVWNWV